MIQMTKNRRTGRAVLAAGAMVASLLAAAAAPAGAATDRADHTTPLLACVGDGLTDRRFTDVPADHLFRGAISCIAYYGITQGTGDGTTYSPDADVTRAQMAVFIARAAEVAGVDLGDATSAGFSDIGGTWPEAADAINRLAANGVIASGGTYRPGDAVTRAEMAMFLVGLLVEAAPDVRRDSQGTILLGVGGSPSVADDYFGDANNAETSALYELGVTRGATAADVQDDTKPPLDFNYEPDRTVTRAQMAAFITRALAHTSARPAGVTAQYDGAAVVVSVRDAGFQPVSDAAVDVFWAPANQAAGAFSDGDCGPAAVTQAEPSSHPCEIDIIDPVTGSDGEVTVELTGLRRVPEGGAVVWAWTGTVGETADDRTGPYRFDVAEGADRHFASSALLAAPRHARKFRFGSSALYSLQLHDVVGEVDTGVNGIDPARWRLSVEVPGEDPDVRTLVSDSRGETSFLVSLKDPDPAAENEVTVTYTLTAADNAPPIVNADGGPAHTGTAVFSDGAASISPGSATVIIDSRDYVYFSGGTASTTVTVTVLDQYGHPFPGAKVKLNNGQESTVSGRGTHSFTHRYTGTAGAAQTLTVGYGAANADGGSQSTTLYWAVDAGENSGGESLGVVAGAVRRRQIVVDDDGEALIVIYDDNDRFNLRGAPTTIAVFEAELADALERGSGGLTLAWSNYRAGSRSRVTEYSLN